MRSCLSWDVRNVGSAFSSGWLWRSRLRGRQVRPLHRLPKRQSCARWASRQRATAPVSTTRRAGRGRPWSSCTGWRQPCRLVPSGAGVRRALHRHYDESTRVRPLHRPPGSLRRWHPGRRSAGRDRRLRRSAGFGHWPIDGRLDGNGVALRAPDRVRSLVLRTRSRVSATSRSPPTKAAYGDAPRVWNNTSTAGPTSRAKPGILRDRSGPCLSLPNLVELRHPRPRSDRRTTSATQFDNALLARMKIPTLFVVGGNDTRFPPAVVRQAATHILGSRVVEIPSAGHSPSSNSPSAGTKRSPRSWPLRSGTPAGVPSSK